MAMSSHEGAPTHPVAHINLTSLLAYVLATLIYQTYANSEVLRAKADFNIIELSVSVLSQIKV